MLLMDDIASFKNSFNSERDSKKIDINKVYDKLLRQFESIGEIIY